MFTVTVLGIGNTLLGDEGFGVRAMRALQDQMQGREDVRFLDGGTLSFTLAPEIARADGLVVIDAAELQAEPGTVRSFVGAQMDDFLGSNRKRSVHEVGLLDLLAIARLDERLPRLRALVAVQPQRVDWGEELSPALAQALPEACRCARELIETWTR